ncbi:MAG: hypothetical protein HYX74_00395 [Acidobacteria bacterium]|nr:hypothetical protein [Acidobacteriota bacterium]
MAKANGNLQQAMALLIQNQAAFVSSLRETHEDIAKIKADLEQIKTILIQHSQILSGLPEAIRRRLDSSPAGKGNTARSKGTGLLLC